MNPWAEAHHEQARSDFAAAEKLRNLGGQVSQTTMLLWIAWEKMAKALLADPFGIDSPPKQHQIADKVLQMLPRAYLIIAPSLGLTEDEALRRGQDLHKSLSVLQILIPKITSTAPNMEYPWKTQSGRVLWPARDLTDRFCSTEGTDRYLWQDFAAISVQFNDIVAVLP